MQNGLGRLPGFFSKSGLVKDPNNFALEGPKREPLIPHPDVCVGLVMFEMISIETRSIQRSEPIRKLV
jgi:hypothetical protein